MGRGLSELQKTILRLASGKRDRPVPQSLINMAKERGWLVPDGPVGCDVYLVNLLYVHYGFTATGIRKGKQTRSTRTKTGEMSIGRNSNHWARPPTSIRVGVGPREYNKALTAVLRAFKRLEERGLLTIHRRHRLGDQTGADLTEAGVGVARKLLVHNHDARRETKPIATKPKTKAEAVEMYFADPDTEKPAPRSVIEAWVTANDLWPSRASGRRYNIL